MIRPIPQLRDRPGYRVPRPVGRIDLYLDGNEGPPPPRSLLATLGHTDVLRRYPSPAALEQTLAERHGVAPEQVLVTAGADDALERACRAFLTPGQRVVLPSPTFDMLDRYACFTGATVIRPPWIDDWPVDAVLDVPDPAVLAVVSPNNPTGAVVSADQLRCVAAARPDTAILVDHAYVEFADPGDDLTTDALAFPQVLVFRTLSKAWGLAGLRVGYVVGAAEPVRWLRSVGQPYAVSGPSLALATAAVTSLAEDVESAAAQTRADRQTVTDTLRAAGFAPRPSRASFVYVPRAPGLWMGLASQGIAVRAWPRDPARPHAVRISVPSRATDLDRLCDAVTTVGRNLP